MCSGSAAACTADADCPSGQTCTNQSKAGDWQCGGTAQEPTGVCGVWKDNPRISSGGKKPPGGHNSDPAANGFNLGAGADPYPPLPDATCTCVGSFHCGCGAENFGAEVKWDLSGLVDNHGNSLTPGHTYRIQGPTFVIEFLNVQADSAGNQNNHIHSCWRRIDGDFGIKKK